MEEPYEGVRHAALATVAHLVSGRLVFLTGSAASGQLMAGLFAEAGAASVYRLVVPEVPRDVARRFAAFEDFLAAPPEDLRREVQRADPQGVGVVYAGSFTAAETFCGRPVIGARQPEHFAAERKDVQRRILGNDRSHVLLGLRDLDGVSRTVAARSVSDMLVLQGIPEHQLAMAASHTYILPSAAPHDRIDKLLEEMARDCASVLLTPPDSGTPCTYYGFVTADWVVDFGPFEALVYWRRDSWQIDAPGIVRPVLLDDQLEAECRSAVHAAARRLHEQTGYVGAFGTDGVVSGRRYVIHEINPRVCAGFALLDQLCPTPAPLAAVDLALRAQPRDASYRLAGPLAGLATYLRSAQHPAIRLWDPGHGPTQDQLLADAAATVTDTDAWLRHVRRSLATSDLMQLGELAAEGARQWR